MIKTLQKDEPVIFKPVFKLSMLAVMLVLSAAILLWIPGLLSSFLITIIFVFILSPIVDFFERHGIGRSNSILITLLLIVVGVALISVLFSKAVVTQYSDLTSRLDVYSSMLKDEMNRQAEDLERKFGLQRYGVSSRIMNSAQDALKNAVQFSGTTFTTLITWLTLVPLLLYFFLLDGNRIKKAFIGFLPNRYFEMSLNIHQKISQIVGNFIRAKLVESLVVGLCALAGFVAMGIAFGPLNYSIFLAFIVGLFNIIPYIGSVIGAIPVLFVAIIQYVLLPQFPEFSGTANAASSWTPVLAAAGVLVFARLVDDLYLQPVVLGHAVNVHPLIVLLSVILGYELLGIIGMVISIPLASILQTMTHEVSEGIRHLRH
jgi:predicted PurR-regulated permease PerM